MAKFKPIPLAEIQKNLGRPEKLSTASRTDIEKYSRRLIKTVNSRIRRLEAKMGGKESYEIARLRKDTELIVSFDPLTPAGYIHLPKGILSVADQRDLVKIMERFLKAKGSTYQGLTEMTSSMTEFMGERFDLTAEEKDAFYRYSLTDGFDADLRYEIESLARWYQERPDRDYEDFIEVVDTLYTDVSADIRPIIDKIWRKSIEYEDGSVKATKTGRK